MKPLHIGLLVVGAAFAGGLAITLTQAPPVPAAIPAAAPLVPPTSPVVGQAAAPAAQPAQTKPSPIPQRVPPPARATAPPAVYDEPAKTAIRKFKPILTAGIARPRPTQWTPAPYDAPAHAAKPLVSASTVEQNVAPPIPAPAPRQVTLHTGMTLPIRLDESLSSDQTAQGTMFEASLVEPFIVDGLAIAERGARVTGQIVTSDRLRVDLGLSTLATSDGQQIAISTDPWTKPIGFGNSLDAGTVIRFRLASKVTITERQIASK